MNLSGTTSVSVNQCRFCGSIIPFTNGVEKHQKICRLTDKMPSLTREQMVIVEFPCPLVIAEKIPEELIPETKMKFIARNIINQTTTTHTTKRPRFKKPIRTSDSDVDKLICPLFGCGTKLKSAFLLKYHLLHHLENNPFACPVEGCNVKCDRQSHLDRHMGLHYGKALPCTECGIFFSRQNLEHKCQGKGKSTRKTFRDKFGQLRSHNAHLTLKRLTAPVEPQTTDLKYDFGKRKKIDINEVIENDPVFIQVCKERPGFRELIFGPKPRKKKPEKSEEFKCTKCERIFSSVRAVKMHETEVHAPRPWKCSKCGRNFTNQTVLQTHMKTHEVDGTIFMIRKDDGTWKCTKCGAESAFIESIKRHWFIIHNIKIPIRRKKSPESKQNPKRGSSVKYSRLKTSKSAVEDASIKNKGVVKSESEVDELVIKAEPEFLEPSDMKMNFSIKVEPEYIVSDVSAEEDSTNQTCLVQNYVKQEIRD